MTPSLRERLARAEAKIRSMQLADRSLDYEYGENRRDGTMPDKGERWLTPREIAQSYFAAIANESTVRPGSLTVEQPIVNRQDSGSTPDLGPTPSPEPAMAERPCEYACPEWAKVCEENDALQAQADELRRERDEANQRATRNFDTYMAQAAEHNLSVDALRAEATEARHDLEECREEKLMAMNSWRIEREEVKRLGHDNMALRQKVEELECNNLGLHGHVSDYVRHREQLTQTLTSVWLAAANKENCGDGAKTTLASIADWAADALRGIAPTPTGASEPTREERLKAYMVGELEYPPEPSPPKATCDDCGHEMGLHFGPVCYATACRCGLVVGHAAAKERG